MEWSIFYMEQSVDGEWTKLWSLFFACSNADFLLILTCLRASMEPLLSYQCGATGS